MSSNTPPEEVRNLQQLALLIGSVSGQISALQTQMQSGLQNTDKRIDDLRGSFDRQARAMNQRIDDHRKSNDQRFADVEVDITGIRDEMKAARNKTLAGSGVVTLIVNGVIEIIKKSF